MYHVRFRGGRREIGYWFGASLAKRGQILLEHVPFPVTQARRGRRVEGPEPEIV